MNNSKRILSFDVGTKTIGVATTDPLWLFAKPLSTVKRSQSIHDDLQTVAETYFNDYPPVAFVVGLPLYPDGKECKITPIAKGTANALKKNFPEIPVFMQEEQYSTKTAFENLNLFKKKNYRDEKDAGKIDAEAAAVILEYFMQKKEFRELKEEFLLDF